MTGGQHSAEHFPGLVGREKAEQDFIGSLAAKQLAVVGGLPRLGGGGPPEDSEKPFRNIIADVDKFNYDSNLATAFTSE